MSVFRPTIDLGKPTTLVNRRRRLIICPLDEFIKIVGSTINDGVK